MFNNSTNINKMNNHISTEIIDYKKDHDIWHWKSSPGLEQAQKCGGCKLVSGIPSLSLLVIGSSTTITEISNKTPASGPKQTIKHLHLDQNKQ